jgi:3,4-dihydroxy 2-butanone 4-phosphate synthase/GTP cyclohydrolase II
MFFGLISNIGKIIFNGSSVNSNNVPDITPNIWTLIVECPATILEDGKCQLGDSIAINGCCLTVSGINKERCQLTFTIMEETLKMTTFRFLKQGSLVHVERSCERNTVDGHIITGHVMGTVPLTNKESCSDGSVILTFGLSQVQRFISYKGSVSIDGVSLTVSGIMINNKFTVSLIPYTQEKTNLGKLNIGDRVNIEFASWPMDVIPPDDGKLETELKQRVIEPIIKQETIENPLERALQSLKMGKPVILMDSSDRENEGDIILPAQFVTPNDVLWFLKYTTGQLCVSCSHEVLDNLQIYQMKSNDLYATPFSESVDLRPEFGVTTGVSAYDRAKTIRSLADPNAKPDWYRKWGHVSTLRANPRGLDGRQGHTEGSVYLCKSAGLYPVALIAELMNHETGEMMRYKECEEFARNNQIPIIKMEDIIGIGKITSPLPDKFKDNGECPPIANLPVSLGDLTFPTKISVRKVDGLEYVILVKGDVENREAVPLRIHSECLTGDVLSSSKCDCGSQLRAYLTLMSQVDHAILIYIRGHEGRGIGLEAKLKCYALQDTGKFDTVEANTYLGLPVDSRSYSGVISILEDLKVKTIHLMTSNPDKITTLGKKVSRVTNFTGQVTPQNQQYLTTKMEKLVNHEKLKPKIGIVYTTRWHSEYVQKMLRQCRQFFSEKKIPIEEQNVSGSFELVMGARYLMKKGCRSVIALGILLKGESYHFDIVASSVANGLLTLQIQQDIPIVLGVLACLTDEQIHERVEGTKNTINDWCQTAIEMACIDGTQHLFV